MTATAKLRTTEIEHSNQFSVDQNGRLVFTPTMPAFLPDPLENPLFIIVDLFCGAGGTSTGFAMAKIEERYIAKIISCVNHDHKAIVSHWKNHPGVYHFEEDIKTLDLTKLIALVEYYRNLYPTAKLILWASLECTNFSKAKGGQPRDADSRTLAEHLYRYIHALDPDYVQIENVVEFMSWGPLDPNGKPVSRKNGQDWMRWRNEICSFGYYDEWKELNSADFGAYTSRNRLFGCFAKEGLPIVWPTPTHSKKASQGMFNHLHKWMPVKDVLNFEDEGESIFCRKKPLSDKTLERIFAGLWKYIAKGDKAFISKYYSGRPAGKVIPVTGPAGTIKCADGQSLIQTEAFLATYHGKGHNTSSIENPAPTIPCKDSIAVLQPKYFLEKAYGNGQNQSIHQPAGAVLPKDKHRLIEAEPFIFNPSHGGNNTGTSNPCPVIVARQDKAPLYLVQAEGGRVAVPVYEHDTEIAIKIKEFMVMFELVDIKMRMLRVQELLKIQGFPEGYELEGSQSDHKKFIGNSVHPLVPKRWAEAMGGRLIEIKKAA